MGIETEETPWFEVAARRKRYRHQQPDVLSGEPAFKGTRIAVRHVGELARKGVSLSMLEDFPRLSESDIEFARDFVRRAEPKFPFIGGE